MGLLDTFYSTKGPLGVWTPVVVVLLNALGVALGLGVVQLFKFLLKPQYDLAKLPQPPVADWVLGHVKHLLRKDYHRVILGWAKQYGRIFKLRILNEWTVVITDPAAAAQVLATVPGRTHNYKHIDEVLGGPGKISMFGTPDEVHWRNARKATAPAFSMANVRRYYGGVLSAAGELLSRLEAELRAAGIFGPAAVVEVAANAEEAEGQSGPRRPPLRLDAQHCPGPEELAKLPRLNAFINEVMRMFPPTAVSAERLTPDEPVTIMGMTFPAKTVLWCITYGIHMSDANWEDAAKFKPERWLEDPRCAFAKSPGAGGAAAAPATAGGAEGPAAAIGGAAEEEPPNTAPRRFVPFGQGPKNCVGQNFGITVVRAVVALLLRRYHVDLHPDMDTSPEGDKLGGGGGGGDGNSSGSGQAGGCRHSAEDTARLTHVAVITKLKKLRLVLQRRDD